MEYLLCVVYMILSLLGLTFMKLGGMEGRQVFFQFLQIKFSLQSLAGYFCYLSSFMIYTVIITKFDLSYIIPLLGGIVNILIFMIGIFLFHENVTRYSLSVCLIVAA